MYQMLILAVSVFCLTSLDTATRLARYMFQEFFVEKGKTAKDLTGYKKVLANPYLATVITVVLGVSLGMTGYTKIWPLFGAANQLLAAVGLLAVCVWLGQVGKNNKMFFVPMTFMLIVTVCSLVQTIIAKMTAFLSGAADYWALIQSVIAVLLVALSLVLAAIAAKTLYSQHQSKKKAANKENAA
jgi:carbon starvation protein